MRDNETGTAKTKHTTNVFSRSREPSFLSSLFSRTSPGSETVVMSKLSLPAIRRQEATRWQDTDVDATSRCHAIKTGIGIGGSLGKRKGSAPLPSHCKGPPCATSIFEHLRASSSLLVLLFLLFALVFFVLLFFLFLQEPLCIKAAVVSTSSPCLFLLLFIAIVVILLFLFLLEPATALPDIKCLEFV